MRISLVTNQRSVTYTSKLGRNRAIFGLLCAFFGLLKADSSVSAQKIPYSTFASPLEQHSERGRFLPELRSIGIKTYREVHFKHYRVIYEVIGREVFVLLIVDGRRSLQAILERRIIR